MRLWFWSYIYVSRKREKVIDYSSGDRCKCILIYRACYIVCKCGTNNSTYPVARDRKIAKRILSSQFLLSRKSVCFSTRLSFSYKYCTEERSCIRMDSIFMGIIFDGEQILITSKIGERIKFVIWDCLGIVHIIYRKIFTTGRLFPKL